jgi:hypothetical protein
MDEIKELERKMKTFDCQSCKFRMNRLVTNRWPFLRDWIQAESQDGRNNAESG